MIKAKVLALFALVATACNEAPTSPNEPMVANPNEPAGSPSPTPAPTLSKGALAVSVNVAGDTKKSLPTFSVKLNGADWARVPLNQVYHDSLGAGSYTVTLADYGLFVESLRQALGFGRLVCRPNGPTNQTVQVKSGELTTTAFSVNCP
jgi:hypothetical protein